MELHTNIGQAIERFRKEFKDLSPHKFRLATARALNRTIRGARTRSVKEIRQRYNVKAAAVKATMSERRAIGANLEAHLRSKGTVIPAFAFGARQTRKGVSISVLKGQRRLIPGAFIATMKNGHSGVMARQKPGGAYAGGKFRGRKVRIRKTGNDLPIGEMLSLSIPKAFANRGVIASLETVAIERFGPTLLHELRFRSGMIAPTGEGSE